jgi:glycosyltransferase involved in cell wall biosynthesis
MSAVDHVSVSSTYLQSRYGGQILYPGPDEVSFDPNRLDLQDRRQLRIRLGLPEGSRLAIFAGTPRPHKGINMLVEALLQPEVGSWELVILGDPGLPEIVSSISALSHRCHSLGFQPYNMIPELLSACDAVVVPQLRTYFSERQFPIKLLDAMALAVPIVSTTVGDIPTVLGHGERGWLVEPGNPHQLSAALQDISANRQEVARRCDAARKWFLKNACRSVVRDNYDALFRRFADPQCITAINNEFRELLSAMMYQYQETKKNYRVLSVSRQ